MIRLGPGNIGLLGSGAHRAGGGKIRLGAGVLILALNRGFNSCSKERRSPGGGKIRLGAGVLILALRRGAHRAGVGKIRLGAGVLILALRRGARRAGGWKIRLGDFSLSGEALAGLGLGRSVSEQGF